jgi:hypothetical protein
MIEPGTGFGGFHLGSFPGIGIPEGAAPGFVQTNC